MNSLANGRNETRSSQFLAGIDQIRKIVGESYVHIEGEQYNAICKATIPEPRHPAALIQPSGTDEIRAIVKICQQYGIALWPVSTGKNWGYGSATPVHEGIAVLKLDRMNKIIEVNEDLAYAIIEPGVTYRQLNQYLKQQHPELWHDTTDGPPDGSVIGNALDRGLGVTHYSDHFGTLCGLEVVLPDGKLIRTGGGPKDCPTWNTHKWGVGPYIEGLFSQSNFGIVTQAGMWLMPKPEKFLSFTFDLKDEQNLPLVIDILRDLALRNILQSACHLANDVVALAILSQFPKTLLLTHSCLPSEILAEHCKNLGIPKWSLGGGIQGSVAQVNMIKKTIRQRLKGLGRVIFMNDQLAAIAGKLARTAQLPIIGNTSASIIRKVTGKSVAMLEAAPHIHSVLQGNPSDYFVRHAYYKSTIPKPKIADPDRDQCGLIWFAPIVPMTSNHVTNVLSICQPLFDKHKFDFYVALLMQNPRSMIVLTAIFFRKEDDVQTAKAQQLYTELNKATFEAGYQTYRISVNGMLHLRKTAPEFINFLKSIKAHIDPSEILAPGKYGL